MIVMRVMGLTIDAVNKMPLVLLQSHEEKALLPIWVGAMEALAISLALQGRELPRPLTHELVCTLVERLSGEIIGMDIVALQGGMYKAELRVQQGGMVYAVPCRPADGLALVVRVKGQVRVDDAVLREVSQTTTDGAASGRIMPAEDVAAEMLRRAQNSDIKPILPQFSLDEVVPPALDVPGRHAQIELQEEDGELAKMLRDMEPDSKRRM